MSVLIKGMEMPTTCRDCRLSTFTDFDSMPFCNITMDDICFNDWETKRCDNCPLIELPPHGRLIDADALHYTRVAIWHNDKTMPMGGYVGGMNAVVMSAEIKAAPTIIPASEEGE